MTENERTMRYCTQCGGELGDHAKFCSHCGAPVERRQSEQDWYTPGETEYTAEQAGFGERAAGSFEKGVSGLLYFLEQKDYIPDDLTEEMFIVENIPYYKGKFNEMRMLKQKVSLNWAALFFGVLWMLYRKMYGVAAAAVILLLVSGCLGVAGPVMGLAVTVGSGLLGNYLYMMTVQKRVTEYHKYGEPARSQYLEKYRGTSSGAVLVGILALALCALPFWLLFGLSFIPMML